MQMFRCECEYFPVAYIMYESTLLRIVGLLCIHSAKCRVIFNFQCDEQTKSAETCRHFHLHQSK